MKTGIGGRMVKLSLIGTDTARSGEKDNKLAFRRNAAIYRDVMVIQVCSYVRVGRLRRNKRALALCDHTLQRSENHKRGKYQFFSMHMARQ